MDWSLSQYDVIWIVGKCDIDREAFSVGIVNIKVSQKHMYLFLSNWVGCQFD